MNRVDVKAVSIIIALMLIIAGVSMIGCKKEVKPEVRAEAEKRVKAFIEADFQTVEYLNVERLYLEKSLKDNDLRIEDFGHTFKEIDKVVYEKVLVKRLNSIKCRRNFGDVKMEVQDLRDVMKTRGFELADLKINESDLQRYIKDGYASEAVRISKLINEDKKGRANEDDIAKMKDFAQKSGKSLAELGIDEKEILKKLKANLAKEGRRIMRMLRAGTCEEFHCPCDEFPRIRQIQAAGVSLEEMGTTEKEVSKYE
jgi:hypothetical protein